MAWEQFVDLFESRERCGDVLECQVRGEGLDMCSSRKICIRQKCFGFRSEGNAVLVQPVVQRFLAGTITREEQVSSVTVPDGERKHPLQAVQAIGSPFPICRE